MSTKITHMMPMCGHQLVIVMRKVIRSAGGPTSLSSGAEDPVDGLVGEEFTRVNTK